MIEHIRLIFYHNLKFTILNYFIQQASLILLQGLHTLTAATTVFSSSVDGSFPDTAPPPPPPHNRPLHPSRSWSLGDWHVVPQGVIEVRSIIFLSSNAGDRKIRVVAIIYINCWFFYNSVFKKNCTKTGSRDGEKKLLIAIPSAWAFILKVKFSWEKYTNIIKFHRDEVKNGGYKRLYAWHIERRPHYFVLFSIGFKQYYKLLC